MRRIAVIAAALSLFHAACEGDTDTSTTPDTSEPAADVETPADDVATSDDAEAPACETECFFNDECAADQRCAETEGQVYGCCEAGARGTGATGASCTAGADCVSGVCMEAANGSLCTEACTADDTCPEALSKCNSFLGVCIPEE